MREELKSLYKWGQKIAENFKTVSSDELARFVLAYQDLTKSNDPKLQKISERAPQILNSLELRHFINFLIPIERELGYRIADPEILPREGDLSTKKAESSELIIIAENWRSAFNVGSLLRTAEGLGAKSVILSGYTPKPDNEKVAQSSLGSETLQSWKSVENLVSIIRELKDSGYTLFAVETSPSAKDVFEIAWPSKTALIFGNERFGILPQTLASVDHICAIKMYGRKNSLNVAVSVGIVGYVYRNSI